jgi:nucleoside-diphosphate-sugar epimerase
MPFEKNVDFYMGEMINRHIHLLSFCRDNNIHYIWPSSALVYEPEKDIAFRRCKLAMEDLQMAYPTKALGLRIFPVYGPGEKRTAIYQWCKSALDGKPIEIYGTGEQKRDFIYIDDVVEQILIAIKKGTTGIIDIGVGKPTSFNDIVKIITDLIPSEVIHIPAPEGYAKGIYSQSPISAKISLEEGIKNFINYLKTNN